MKYTLRNLMVVVAVLGVMAGTLRMRSPHSVLVMLVCVCGLLAWAAVASYFATGVARRVLAIAAIGGFGYLAFYVFTDTAVEIWINAVAIGPFASMKAGGTEAIPAAELRQFSNSMEFQYMQQKLHLILAVVVACVAGWIASA